MLPAHGYEDWAQIHYPPAPPVEHSPPLPSSCVFRLVRPGPLLLLLELSGGVPLACCSPPIFLLVCFSQSRGLQLTGHRNGEPRVDGRLPFQPMALIPDLSSAPPLSCGMYSLLCCWVRVLVGDTSLCMQPEYPWRPPCTRLHHQSPQVPGSPTARPADPGEVPCACPDIGTVPNFQISVEGRDEVHRAGWGVGAEK